MACSPMRIEVSFPALEDVAGGEVFRERGVFAVEEAAAAVIDDPVPAHARRGD